MSGKPTKAQVEMLERENKYLREALARFNAVPEDCPLNACDNSCACAKPRGMSTNGGCRCDENKLRMAVTWWRARAAFLQATIAMMRDGDPVKHWEDGREMMQSYVERMCAPKAK